MNDQTKIVTKTWYELTSEELEQLNANHLREWKSSAMSKKYHGENIFFFLKDLEKKILAQGQLIPVNGVRFNDETFDIFGIGGIIANVKGQGYGKAIMLALKDYLLKQKKSGVGFTGISGFYEKCGFSVHKKSIKRFVYTADNKRILNTESDRICYLDSKDKLMEKVLTHPDEDVLLPRPPDW